MQIDLRLIEQCRRGDRRAQLRLYDLCYSYMMSICIRYGKDEQEAGARLNMAFLKILQHLDQFDGSGGSFKAWISKITVRTLIDDFRSQRRHYQVHVYHGEEWADQQWAEEEISFVDEHLDTEQIILLIQNLPEMMRQVFNLFVFEGLSHKEISATFGISEGTSKWHLHEARKRLKEVLMKELKITSFK